MKKICSKLAGFFRQKKSDPSNTKLPNSVPLWGEAMSPTPYLKKGWLVSQGNLQTDAELKSSIWDSYLKINLDDENDNASGRASWSVGDNATLALPIPTGLNGDCYILMVLKGLLTEANKLQQKVLVHVDGEKTCEWLIDTDQVVAKLLVVPASKGNKKGVWEITLNTPDAVVSESVPLSQNNDTLGVELYSITILNGREEYLARVQAIWDGACSYRNELLEMEAGQELQDRGELVDIVKNVLLVLQDTEGDFSSVRKKLDDFLANPYIFGSSDDGIIFDGDYFAQKFEELKEGKIECAITKWKHDLFNYKEAVMDAGNYAFRRLSTENRESYSILDNFLQENKFSAEKLTELKKKNEKLNNLEILLQKTELESVPPLLEIEMTSFCNFRCVMCSRSMIKFLHIQQNDLQILQISKILPYIQYVTIAGVGEPCSSKKLELLSRVLQMFNCPTLMFTNGSLLHKQLDAASRFAKINVSFDGPNEKILGAQRRNSKFETIVENIKKLRKKSPDLHIGFSVVVSRINVDEIAAIVRLAEDLKVTDVNLSPVVNVSLLELKESDRQVYEKQLATAREIEKSGKVVVHNNVHQNTFSNQNDTPREKEKLMDYFSNLKVPTDISHNLDKVIGNLAKNEFHYFPAEAVFANNKWPDPPQIEDVALANLNTMEVNHKFDFNVEDEIARLDKAIERLGNEVRSKPKEWFNHPFCLSVWKYGYVKSNGKNRLCPHRNVALGNYREFGPKQVLNSPVIKKYRESMLNIENVSPMCKDCADHHRVWGIDSLKNTCEEYGLDIKKFVKIGE